MTPVWPRYFTHMNERARHVMISAMKKDDALALRERLRAVAEETAARLGVAGLEDDGKLYHDEVGDVARWAQRLSVPARWPHKAVGVAGAPACPGLRLEIWYFAGKANKDEELLFLALCDGENGLGPLQGHLKPVFQQLIEGGKYARRYKALEPMVAKFYPGAIGVGRRSPVLPAKAEAALNQLLDDTLKLLDQAVAAHDPEGKAPADFEAACGAYDPLAALKAKFGK